MTTLLFALALVFVAFLIAISALLAIGWLQGAHQSRLPKLAAEERGRIVFLFDDETLVDASPSARELIETSPRRDSDWARLTLLLEPRFPDLNSWICELAELGHMERTSSDGTSILHADWHDGVARLWLSSTGDIDLIDPPDQHALTAMTRELDLLRSATEHTNHPIWHEDDDGQVTWCNEAYLELVTAVEGEGERQEWPPRRIFDFERGLADGTERLALSLDGENERRWFMVEHREDSHGVMCSAVTADELVNAETALNEFVTTLSKTFASLPIGLAIFNRDRELAMFNPALLDLTQLPIDFLVGKPALASVLDRMREMQMMPEPKDYKSWRQQVSDLVTEAQNGTYEEKWTLPGGQTYRVTGRPHPDGAVAFLFEDISTEVSSARRFHAEIATSQSALDALPQAIAVFSTAGVLTISNRAYTDLWGFDPTERIGEISVYDAIENWRSSAAPNRVWDDIRAYVGHAGSRDPWNAQVALEDGRSLTCRVAPLHSGFTMVEFSFQEQNDLLLSDPALEEPRLLEHA